MRRKKASMFFSEEKNQKTLFLRRFLDRGHGRDVAAAPEVKVFCFFSSEKKIFKSRPGRDT
jgi:hypothetical protein